MVEKAHCFIDFSFLFSFHFIDLMLFNTSLYFGFQFLFFYVLSLNIKITDIGYLRSWWCKHPVLQNFLWILFYLYIINFDRVYFLKSLVNFFLTHSPFEMCCFLKFLVSFHFIVDRWTVYFLPFEMLWDFLYVPDTAYIERFFSMWRWHF